MSNSSYNSICRAVLFAGALLITAAPQAAIAEGPENLESKVSSQNAGFDWMANGNSVSQREARARKNALRASMISSRDGATWICSPAGFGQRSRCHKS